MFYLIVSGSMDRYSYTPMKPIRSIHGRSLDEMTAQIQYFHDCLGDFSCIHTTIYSIDEESGEIEVHHNHLEKVPLKVRKEINQLQKDVIKKVKQPTMMVFDDVEHMEDDDE